MRDNRHWKAVAWDRWLFSPDGKRGTAGSAQGEYLRNRLFLAFLAGIEAAESNAADGEAVPNPNN